MVRSRPECRHHHDRGFARAHQRSSASGDRLASMTSTSISTTTPICPSPCPRPTDRPVGPLWRPTASYASRFPTARCRPRAASLDHEQRRERLQPHRTRPGQARWVQATPSTRWISLRRRQRRHRIVPIDHNVRPSRPGWMRWATRLRVPLPGGDRRSPADEQVVNLQQKSRTSPPACPRTRTTTRRTSRRSTRTARSPETARGLACPAHGHHQPDSPGSDPGERFSHSIVGARQPKHRLERSRRRE